MRKLLSVLFSTLQGGVRGGLLFVTLIATTSLWAQRFQVGDLYYRHNLTEIPIIEATEGAVTIVWNQVGFTPCADNQLVFAGDYNGYNTDPAAMAHFEAVEGANGWYVAVITPADASLNPVLAGKPCALAQDGSFPASWDYQWWNVEEGDCEILDGSDEAVLVFEYYVEPKLLVSNNSSVVYIRSYGFKEDPCYEPKQCIVTFNATTPNLPEGFNGYIVGAFNGWASNTPMEFANDIWTVTLDSVEMGDGYKYLVNGIWEYEELAAIEEGAECAAGIYDRRVNDVVMIDKVEKFKDITIAKCDDGLYAPQKNQEELPTVMVTYESEWSGENYQNLSTAYIPETVVCNGRTYKVVGVDEFAFANSSLTSVTIPNSVTSIGTSAFFNCSSLTSVTIPNSVINIGDGAFSGCDSIASIVVEQGNVIYDSRNNCNAVIETATNTLISGCKNTTIPNSVTSIGYSAFSGCSSLNSVTIPNSVTSIGYSAFYGCSSLTSVTIGKGVTSIGSSAFSGCSSLTSITIPNSVTSIGRSAFRDCSSFTSITIPESVKSIGEWAFFNCSSLTFVTIGESVTSIGDLAFNGCSKIDSIVWKAENYANFLEKENAPFYDCRSQIKSFTFGEAVEYLPAYLCYGMEKLTNIVLFNKTKTIGTSAFEGCIRLGKVTLGSSIQNIAAKAFAGCTRLYDVYCYATYPPFADATSFANYNAYLYVPCENQRDYTLDMVWGNFKFIECITSEDVSTNGVVITPSTNDVTITWPTEDNADTYTIVIKKDGEVVCTLTFNAEGQLLNIAFAPGRDGNHPAQYAEQAGNGYRFTVTGLEEGTHYAYNIDVKDAANKTIKSHTGEFTTESLTAVENTHRQSPITDCQKILRNGQLLILRDGKTYTIMGQEI